MFGGRSRRGRRSGEASWTPGELYIQKSLYDFLEAGLPESPIFRAVAAVIFAKDRDEELAAIERYPDLLTDKGAAAFEAVAIWVMMLGEDRVTQAVRQKQATVQAIREARA